MAQRAMIASAAIPQLAAAFRLLQEQPEEEGTGAEEVFRALSELWGAIDESSDRLELCEVVRVASSN